MGGDGVGVGAWLEAVYHGVVMTRRVDVVVVVLVRRYRTRWWVRTASAGRGFRVRRVGQGFGGLHAAVRVVEEGGGAEAVDVEA